MGARSHQFTRDSIQSSEERWSVTPYPHIQIKINMIQYIFRRFIQVIITVWIIATITFLAIRLAPGDPATVMIGQTGTVYEYESVSKQLGLDRPLYVQYFEYMKGIIIGDLGDSMYFKKSIISMIWQQLPPTIIITVMAIFMTVVFGIPLGIVFSNLQKFSFGFY